MENRIYPTVTDTAYAGFWIRSAAFFIDIIIAGTITGILSSVLFGNYHTYHNSIEDPRPAAVSIIVNWLYFAWQESSVRQATIGKLSVGIIVCTENKERLTFANASGRFFAKILSCLILLLGFIMIAFDDKKQGLHDKLAKTLVLYR